MSYQTLRLRDISSQPRWLVYWEKVKYTRVHLVTELVAEMIGVFLYVYAGVGSTAAFVVGNLLSQPIGSLFTVGTAYAIGIMLAIVVCGAASACHFNPAVTISFIVFRGFPPRKAVLYILAQIFGAYLACLVIYVQYKDLIAAAEGVLMERGHYETMMFTPDGPGGIFALYVLPGTNLGRVLLNEFMTDFVIGLTISASINPTNHMIPPAAAPWVIGATYGVAICGFAPTAIATNAARDVGARMMAMTVWGRQAAGGPYAVICALTNIPATALAFFFYDIFLGSSSRPLTPQHVAFLKARKIYLDEHGLVPPGFHSALGPQEDATPFGSFDEKPTKAVIEVGARNV